MIFAYFCFFDKFLLDSKTSDVKLFSTECAAFIRKPSRSQIRRHLFVAPGRLCEEVRAWFFRAAQSPDRRQTKE
jgi:hypothetical protein